MLQFGYQRLHTAISNQLILDILIPAGLATKQDKCKKRKFVALDHDDGHEGKEDGQDEAHAVYSLVTHCCRAINLKNKNQCMI